MEWLRRFWLRNSAVVVGWGLFFGYVFAGAFTGVSVHRSYGPPRECPETLPHVEWQACQRENGDPIGNGLLAGLFWPVVAPVVIASGVLP